MTENVYVDADGNVYKPQAGDMIQLTRQVGLCEESDIVLVEVVDDDGYVSRARLLRTGQIGGLGLHVPRAFRVLREQPDD